MVELNNYNNKINVNNLLPKWFMLQSNYTKDPLIPYNPDNFTQLKKDFYNSYYGKNNFNDVYYKKLEKIKNNCVLKNKELYLKFIDILRTEDITLKSNSIQIVSSYKGESKKRKRSWSKKYV